MCFVMCNRVLSFVNSSSMVYVRESGDVLAVKPVCGMLYRKGLWYVL